jgi:cytochrome c oxidase cbb3-type subunit 3
MTEAMTGRIALALLLILAAVPACKREERETRPAPVAERDQGEITVSGLHAGPEPAPPASDYPDYTEDAYHVSEGKRLFESFNCNGCHAMGGGDIGPPLIDAKWVYGAEPANIYATIVEGRPNGMPSFRGKIPEQQVWQLVAYVRSLGGFVRKDVASGRSDAMSARPSEQSLPALAPRETGERPTTEGTQ